MAEIFSKIVDKLSAYQLFNYLFPGIVFNMCVEQIMTFKIAPDNLLYKIFVYYITGMVLSRIGSNIIEPIYKKLCFVVYAKYNHFLEASANDSKLDILVLENNTYRTLIATFFSLLLLYLIDQIQWFHDKYQHPIAIIAYMLILIFIFSVSFRKQTEFIRKKVHKNQNLNDRDEINKFKEAQRNINIWKQIIT